MRDEASDVVDTDAQTAEDGLCFFHGFLESQYKSVSYGDCVGIATGLFQPSVVIGRAHAAVVEQLNGGVALNMSAFRDLVTSVEQKGLEATLCEAAQQLQDTRRVLTRAAVEEFFPDNPDREHLLNLTDGCEIPVHPEFVPNYWEGASMRASQMQTPAYRVWCMRCVMLRRGCASY